MLKDDDDDEQWQTKKGQKRFAQAWPPDYATNRQTRPLFFT